MPATLARRLLASTMGFAHLEGLAPPAAERREPVVSQPPAPAAQPVAPSAVPAAKRKTDDDGDEDPDDEDEEGDDEDDRAEAAGRHGRRVRAARARERARCAAIFAAPEAARNPRLAAHLAFETGLGRDAAIATLREGATAAGLGSRMQRAPDAAVVGGGAERPGRRTEAETAASLDRAFAKTRRR